MKPSRVTGALLLFVLAGASAATQAWTQNSLPTLITKDPEFGRVFKQYEKLKKKSDYRVFVAGLYRFLNIDLDKGKTEVVSGHVYAHLSGDSYEDTLERAFKNCNDLLNTLDSNIAGQSCRLLAVGDTIVWEMSEDELAEIVANYKSQAVERREKRLPKEAPNTSNNRD